MPEENFGYSLARAKRRDEAGKKKGPKVTLGEGMRQVEPGDPGTGAYSDRIKIKPKFEAQPSGPLPSDTEIQKAIKSQVTKV